MSTLNDITIYHTHKNPADFSILLDYPFLKWVQNDEKLMNFNAFYMKKSKESK